MPHQPGHTTSAGRSTAMANQAMQDCIDACTTCAQVCLETVDYCLGKGGDHAAQAHIRDLLDCVDICQTSAGFLTRQSEHHASTCRVCAEVCRACAESCSQFTNDAQMKKCADACRRCAESCEQMAAA